MSEVTNFLPRPAFELGEHPMPGRSPKTPPVHRRNAPRPCTTEPGRSPRGTRGSTHLEENQSQSLSDLLRAPGCCPAPMLPPTMTSTDPAYIGTTIHGPVCANDLPAESLLDALPQGVVHREHTERLEQEGAVTSIGYRAIVPMMPWQRLSNGLCKTELIYRQLRPALLAPCIAAPARRGVAITT